jgi:hypothetical protein
MGCTFGFVAVSPVVPAAELLRALGAAHAKPVGPIECPLPLIKADSHEAWFLQSGEWSILACSYSAGVLSGYDAAPLAALLPQVQELRYFAQADTNAEVMAQVFKGGKLVLHHSEYEGIVEADKAVGPPAPKNEYEQTDKEALFSSVVPLALSEPVVMEHFHVTWPEA